MKRHPSVAIVSRSNAIGGGASRIAEELAECLINSGSDVVHFCALPQGPLRSFQAPTIPSKIAAKVSRATHRVTRLLGLNEIFPTEYYASLSDSLREYDVVHFHDLIGAISPLTLQLCSREKPVVFTAHDCSSFTGGCIYPLKCNRYRNGCRRCPQLGSIGARFDFTSVNLRINRLLARNERINFVFPSKWLKETASRSLDFRRMPEVIPNGFESKGYDFRTRSDARAKLGIRDEQRVILVAAHYLADPRKGITFALAAIRSVEDLNPLVIFVGIPPHDLEALLPNTSFWIAGFVSDRKKLGLLYAAANTFLFPSLQDNLPIMVQESLAAGTPVVGFASGGVPEIVDHMVTGWLCDPGDQITLNQLLRCALQGNNLPEFGRTAKVVMNERYNMKVFGERHLEIYGRMAS